jgi:hypothetical protein
MDTFKDKQHLEELNQGSAPWKVWNHSDSLSADCKWQPIERDKEQSMVVSARV